MLNKMALCVCVCVYMCVCVCVRCARACVCELTVVCLCEVFSPRSNYGTINSTAVSVLAFIDVTWLITLRGRNGNSTMGIRFFNLRGVELERENTGEAFVPLASPLSHAYDRHRSVWDSGGVAPQLLNYSTKLWGITRLTILPVYL